MFFVVYCKKLNNGQQKKEGKIMKYSYFKLKRFPVIEFVNFEEAKDFLYVSISRVSRTITIYVKEMQENDYRFRVDIPKDSNNLVFNSRLYHLLNDYGLDRKMFVYDDFAKTYMATEFSVDEKENN